MALELAVLGLCLFGDCTPLKNSHVLASTLLEITAVLSDPGTQWMLFVCAGIYLLAFVVLRWLSSGKLDHIPSDLVEKVAPKLKEYMNRVAVVPAIAQYYSNCGPS